MIYDDRVEVMRGKERRAAVVQTGEDGGRFAISPFTGKKLDLPPLTEPPGPVLRWHNLQHQKLGDRLEQSRRCPDRVPERLKK